MDACTFAYTFRLSPWAFIHVVEDTALVVGLVSSLPPSPPGPNEYPLNDGPGRPARPGKLRLVTCLTQSDILGRPNLVDAVYGLGIPRVLGFVSSALNHMRRSSAVDGPGEALVDSCYLPIPKV